LSRSAEGTLKNSDSYNKSHKKGYQVLFKTLWHLPLTRRFRKRMTGKEKKKSKIFEKVSGDSFDFLRLRINSERKMEKSIFMLE
jgi:hypothetical protein